VVAFGTGPLLPLAQAGIGGGHHNYISYGSFEMNQSGKKLLFKPGVIMGLNGGMKVKSFDQKKITESVYSSWYRKTAPKHPYEGEQVFDLKRSDAYSFVKSPRYDGVPMEVGPLARALVDQDPTILGLVKNQGVKPGAVARHAARPVSMRPREVPWDTGYGLKITRLATIRLLCLRHGTRPLGMKKGTEGSTRNHSSVFPCLTLKIPSTWCE
jgi:hypothetical protein